MTNLRIYTKKVIQSNIIQLIIELLN